MKVLMETFQTLIEAADGLISAIEGVTDQFEPEVAALCEAVSAAEKALGKARGQK
jgi:C4-type Zn-finger protein